MADWKPINWDGDPVESSRMSSKLRAFFSATANPQPSSSFFQRLPIEIRQMIYVELWRISRPRGTLRYHIVRKAWPSQKLRLTHTECITDVLEGTQQQLPIYPTGLPSDPPNLHLACREEDLRELECRGLSVDREQYTSTFLPALLTCKQMYLECLPSIYSNLTFSFGDMSIAVDFLLRYRLMPLRSLDLTFQLGYAFVCLYLHCLPPRRPAPTHPSDRTRDDNRWTLICDLLAERCSGTTGTGPLHELRIAILFPDSHLNWSSILSETLLFSRLRNVRGVRDSFILILPQIRNWIEPLYHADSNYDEPDRALHWLSSALNSAVNEHQLHDPDLLDELPFCVLRCLDIPLKWLATQEKWFEEYIAADYTSRNIWGVGITVMHDRTRARYWDHVTRTKFWPLSTIAKVRAEMPTSRRLPVENRNPSISRGC